MAKAMQVSNNPVKDYGDEKLKRAFSNLYADIHCHGIDDGLKARAALKLMELELKSRDFDPSEHIGPRVITAD